MRSRYSTLREPGLTHNSNGRRLSAIDAGESQASIAQGTGDSMRYTIIGLLGELMAF